MEEQANEIWEAENLENVLSLLLWYRTQYTGSREPGCNNPYAEGHIGNVKAMGWYEDPELRSNGALENLNSVLNRVTKRTIGKNGNKIEAETFILAHRHMECLAKAEVELIDLQFETKKAKRTNTKATKKMLAVKKKYGRITAENVDAYFEEMKSLLGNK